MISGSNVFYAVNAILAVVSIVLIILASKSMQDKGAKKIYIPALVLLILSAVILSVCLGIYKMGAMAYVGQVAGVAEGAYDQVKKFRFYGLVGTILELLSVVLLTVVSAKLISSQPKEQTGEEE